jgi:hypothetical protein
VANDASGREESKPEAAGAEAAGPRAADWLKASRTNLKPVLRPFQRPEQPAEQQSPVELLINGPLSAAAMSATTSPEREAARRQKRSEEYMMVNFPADVRKNLRGCLLPEPGGRGGNLATRTAPSPVSLHS